MINHIKQIPILKKIYGFSSFSNEAKYVLEFYSLPLYLTANMDNPYHREAVEVAEKYYDNDYELKQFFPDTLEWTVSGEGRIIEAETAWNMITPLLEKEEIGHDRTSIRIWLTHNRETIENVIYGEYKEVDENNYSDNDFDDDLELNSYHSRQRYRNNNRLEEIDNEY